MSAPPRQFTVEEIRMLVEIERAMDRGEQPYIFVGDCTTRAAMEQSDMETYGLEVGQRVPEHLFTEMLRAKVATLTEQVAYQRFVAEIEGGEARS